MALSVRGIQKGSAEGNVSNEENVEKCLLLVSTPIDILQRAFRESERSKPNSSVVRAPAYVYMETETWVRVLVWTFYSWTHPARGSTIYIDVE